ncbi:MAG: MarR family transcriptional regulator [Alphaproteobacteria bacterium]|nr:MAG: MarR family transcriptional regulator [Alphaproteobacteria bacterium]
MAETGPILILEDFLPYRLSVLSNTVSRGIASIYAERFNLSIPAWRVMAILGRFSGLSAGEVAERTAMDKVAVSRAVAHLIKEGLLTRDFADDDRRRSVLALTEKGWSVYREVVPLALEVEKDLLASLTLEEQETLSQLMGKLLDRALDMEKTDKSPRRKAYGAVV